MQTCHAISEPLSEPLFELYSGLPPTPLHTRPESGCETLTPSSPNALHIEEEEGSVSSLSKKGATLQNRSLEIADASKGQPVINSSNAYSLRTDLYLPSFSKMPQVKEFNNDPQEYFKSITVLPDGIADLVFEANKSKVIQSHEQVTVDGENALSLLPCPQNLTPENTEGQLSVATELGNGYTFTQSLADLGGSIVSNGVLQKQMTSGFQSDTGPVDSPWVQDSSQVTFPETSAREQISASRQASMECMT